MEPTEKMLQNYDKANNLRDWADLFGFQVSMGREDGSPFVEVDGVLIRSQEVAEALVVAARAMGMSEERLNGDAPPAEDFFLRLR